MCEVVLDCIHLLFLSRFGTSVRSLFVLALSYCNIFSLYVNLSRIHLKSLAYRWCGRFFFFLESEQSVILTSKKKRNKNINAKTKLWIDHRIFVFLLLLFFEHYSILQSSIGCVCVYARFVYGTRFTIITIWRARSMTHRHRRRSHSSSSSSICFAAMWRLLSVRVLTLIFLQHIVYATPPHIYNIMNYDDDFSNWKKLYCILCITITINK